MNPFNMVIEDETPDKDNRGTYEPMPFYPTNPYDTNASICRLLIQKDTNVWPNIVNILEKLPFVIEVNIISLTNSQGRIIVKFMGNKKTFFQAVFEKKLKFKDLNSQQYVLIN